MIKKIKDYTIGILGKNNQKIIQESKMKISITKRLGLANVYREKSFYLKGLIFSFFLPATLWILFSFSSCEETTKPETVAFSGTVTLEGKTDHSPIGAGGVKVSFYKPVELSYRDYSIGYSISQN